MAKQEDNQKTVTRIKASDGGKNKVFKRNQKPAKAENVPRRELSDRGFIGSFFGYFVGAWKELRQVRWPDRKATWSLTGAVLAFSTFFIIFILILDAIFKYLFETILK